MSAMAGFTLSCSKATPVYLFPIAGNIFLQPAFFKEIQKHISMQKNALVAGATFMALCACSCRDKKTSDPTPDPPVVYDNYTKLEVGNYWIYQLYDVDSLGNGSALNQFDSVF